MEYLNINLLQIYYQFTTNSVCDKNLSQLIFGEVVGKSLVSCFFDLQCMKLLCSLLMHLFCCSPVHRLILLPVEKENCIFS